MSQSPSNPYDSDRVEDAPADASVPPYGQPTPTSPYLSTERTQSYGSPGGDYRGLAPQDSYNPWAIASLVLGLCATAVLAVVTGHVALAQIKRSGERGTGLAIAGLVLGYLMTLVYVGLIVAAFSFVTWAGSRT